MVVRAHHGEARAPRGPSSRSALMIFGPWIRERRRVEGGDLAWLGAPVLKTGLALNMRSAGDLNAAALCVPAARDRYTGTVAEGAC
jgi:hypothetical protein